VNWEALNAISGTVGTGVVLTGTLIALRQFREVLQARHLQGTLGMVEKLESRSVRATRRFLGLHREDLAQVCAGDNWKIELDGVLQQLSHGRMGINQLRDDLAILEYAALFVLHGMVPASMGKIYFLPIVVSAWPDICPIVQAERRAMGSEIYLQHFEELYNLAIAGEFEDRRKRKKSLTALRKKSTVAIQADRMDGSRHTVNKDLRF
jgi:hypothetical protein